MPAPSSAATQSSLPCHGMRGWSQLSQARCAPSGERRGLEKKSWPAASTVSAPRRQVDRDDRVDRLAGAAVVFAHRDQAAARARRRTRSAKRRAPRRGDRLAAARRGVRDRRAGRRRGRRRARRRRRPRRRRRRIRGPACARRTAPGCGRRRGPRDRTRRRRCGRLRRRGFRSSRRRSPTTATWPKRIVAAASSSAPSGDGQLPNGAACLPWSATLRLTASLSTARPSGSTRRSSSARSRG